MSLIREYNRIKNIKYDIANAIKNKGITISNNINFFNTYPSLINNINSANDYGIYVYNNDELKQIFFSLDGDLSYCMYSEEYSDLCNINRIEIKSKIFNISHAFSNRYNLTGSPACGNNVINMSSTYSNCRNLTGSPVCGNNVTSMYRTYEYCYNLYGNGYFYSNKVNDASYCFSNRNTSKRLNLYVPSTGYNSSHNTLAQCLITNTYSLVGASITWTQSGSNYYNTYYNIYIYPVSNVAAARANNGD